ELLRAERGAGTRGGAVALKVDEFDDRLDGGTVLDLLPAHARQEQHLRKRAGANARVPAGEQIVEHAHLRKQFSVLEGAGDTEPRYLMRRKTGDVAPAEADYPGAAIDAADAVEHAGLAGTVRADQRQKLLALDRKRNAVEYDKAAEPQPQILDCQFSHTISGC